MISETFNEYFEVSPNFPFDNANTAREGFLDVAVMLDAIDAKLFNDVQLHCPQLESCFTDMHKLIRMAVQMVEQHANLHDDLSAKIDQERMKINGDKNDK